MKKKYKSIAICILFFNDESLQETCSFIAFTVEYTKSFIVYFSFLFCRCIMIGSCDFPKILQEKGKTMGRDLENVACGTNEHSQKLRDTELTRWLAKRSTNRLMYLSGRWLIRTLPKWPSSTCHVGHNPGGGCAFWKLIPDSTTARSRDEILEGTTPTPYNFEKTYKIDN